MADIIMGFSIFVFAVLFIFLLFTSFTSLLSIFKAPYHGKFQPDVSIIVPCYNEEKNISSCIEAIYSSTFPKDKFEVIVVDDGSTDDTKDIITRLVKQHPALHLVDAGHQGKSEALNLGVKKARHDFVLTLDADTIIAPDSIAKMLGPFSDKKVAATNGSCVVRNNTSILSIFQNIEYHYNNLIRKSFSNLFDNGIWFFGAFACYRKSIIEKIGYFKKDTLTEDMDTALEIYSLGHKIINVHDAIGYTIVPHTLSGFVKQRTRWWAGVIQSLNKSSHLFSHKSSPSVIFLFINQYWWTIFAFLSIPLIAYQYNYWLSSNLTTFYTFFMYTFRWFSLLGPFYVLYKIPEWGISLYSIFGVLSGIISAVLITYSVYLFKDRMGLKNILAIIFYFPYTIVLNTIIIMSIFKIIFLKRSYFIH